MNFLQIAQRAARECRLPWTELRTVVNQGGDYRGIVDSVNEAWMELQGSHQDWDWMRASTSFVTVNGQAIYPLGTGSGTAGVASASFGMWARNTFRNYVTSVGLNSEFPMDYLGYDAWRDTYQFGAFRNTRTRPTTITIDPSHGIGVGPYPNAEYTVTGDYYAKPSMMSANADEPSLPPQYHMALVWKAVHLFASPRREEERKYSSIADTAEFNYMVYLRRITADRLPTLTFGGPLA